MAIVVCDRFTPFLAKGTGMYVMPLDTGANIGKGVLREAQASLPGFRRDFIQHVVLENIQPGHAVYLPTCKTLLVCTRQSWQKPPRLDHVLGCIQCVKETITRLSPVSVSIPRLVLHSHRDTDAVESAMVDALDDLPVDIRYFPHRSERE